MAVTYEIYENGNFIKSIKRLNSIDNFVRNYRKNYKCIYESCGGDHGFYIFVNIGEQKIFIIAYKEFLGAYDKNGEKLYKGDIIRDEYGNEVEIYEHYDWDNNPKKKPKYYYRIQKNNWGYVDYDITDFSKYTKVKDIFKSFTI